MLNNMLYPAFPRHAKDIRDLLEIHECDFGELIQQAVDLVLADMHLISAKLELSITLTPMLSMYPI